MLTASEECVERLGRPAASSAHRHYLRAAFDPYGSGSGLGYGGSSGSGSASGSVDFSLARGAAQVLAILLDRTDGLRKPYCYEWHGMDEREGLRQHNQCCEWHGMDERDGQQMPGTSSARRHYPGMKGSH